MPSSSEHDLSRELGGPLPTGCVNDAHEINAAGGRKELQWNATSARQKGQWSQAAEKGWAAYVDNDAVQVLSLKESLGVRKELARQGELDRILTPRFVLSR